MELRQLSSGQTLTLPDDLLWADEHAWTPAVASTTYLITGALLVQSATRQAGRPITLVGPSDMAWVTRATVAALHAWAALPLTLDEGRFAAYREHFLSRFKITDQATRHKQRELRAAAKKSGQDAR